MDDVNNGLQFGFPTKHGYVQTSATGGTTSIIKSNKESIMPANPLQTTNQHQPEQNMSNGNSEPRTLPLLAQEHVNKLENEGRTETIPTETKMSDKQIQEWKAERAQLLKTVASLKQKLEDQGAQLAAANKPAESVESRLKAVAGKQWYKGFGSGESAPAAANVFKGWFNRTAEPTASESPTLQTSDPLSESTILDPTRQSTTESLKQQLKNTELELNESRSLLEKYRTDAQRLESKLKFSRDEIEQQSLLLKNGEESKLLFQSELKNLMMENAQLTKELEHLKGADSPKKSEKSNEGLDKRLPELKSSESSAELKRQSKLVENEQLTKLKGELEEAKAENLKLETTIQEINCNYQFIVDSLTERDEKIKRQKATIESLKTNQEANQLQLQKLEKEKESMTVIVSTLTEQESAKDVEISSLKSIIEQNKTKIDALILESQSLKDQVQVMKDKYEMSEQEHSISGKKATQLLKDLQKELKRKGPVVPEHPENPGSIFNTFKQQPHQRESSSSTNTAPNGNQSPK